MSSKKQDTIDDILECINRFHMTFERAPSNLEIAQETGLSAPTVCRYLQYMREQDLIESSEGRRPITAKLKKMRPDTIMVPVLGSIACGCPKLAEENIDKYIPLPIDLYGRGDFYALYANGDSMIDIGIGDGDLVLIRQQDTADPGQVVVAYMNDEEVATLKRYFPEPKKHRVRLHPENQDMQDIFVENCSVQGIAVRVIDKVIK